MISWIVCEWSLICVRACTNFLTHDGICRNFQEINFIACNTLLLIERLQKLESTQIIQKNPAGNFFGTSDFFQAALGVIWTVCIFYVFVPFSVLSSQLFVLILHLYWLRLGSEVSTSYIAAITAHTEDFSLCVAAIAFHIAAVQSAQRLQQQKCTISRPQLPPLKRRILLLILVTKRSLQIVQKVTECFCIALNAADMLVWTTSDSFPFP